MAIGLGANEEFFLEYSFCTVRSENRRHLARGRVGPLFNPGVSGPKTCPPFS